jgi:hypothetical protein
VNVFRYKLIRGDLIGDTSHFQRKAGDIEPRPICEDMNMGAYLRMGLRSGFHSQDLFSRGSSFSVSIQMTEEGIGGLSRRQTSPAGPHKNRGPDWIFHSFIYKNCRRSHRSQEAWSFMKLRKRSALTRFPTVLRFSMRWGKSNGW